MIKKLLLLLLLFCIITVSAQTKDPVGNGVITLSSGTTTGFINLRFINDMVVYHDVVNKKEMAYKLSEISLIRNDEQKEIYKNPDLILKEQKRIASKTDSLFKPNYPEGIYETKEDFINKKPTLNIYASPVSIYGKNHLMNVSDECFFLKVNGDKLKRVFAVSHKGHLYFQLKAILKNRNKTDRAQTNDHPNSFVRVINGGDNYLYMEADLANQWAQGFAYGGVGGIAGALMADDMINGKGIVWDFKNQEFNIFKNCSDFNKFIEPLYPEGKQECKHQQANILEVRKAIEKIK